ncbi:hypothetical protein Pcinc_002369 [Petrolisthes cinctipes]|uniref:Uncharacterized protein n=1 Tax=Petrolisthes cinctipes TaxID=88211 RepID=A0AAE1GID0_PETCI|nr:hypothetical protein Pcinc_002369 [Petrolisthes cinctipes]
MSSLKELFELGKELGFEGQFLAEFVKDEHERDRQVRQEEREIRKAEHDREVLRIQLRKEEQEREIEKLRLHSQLQAGQEAVDTPVMKVRGPSLPYFDESTVLAVCIERPICDVIVGNLEGATQLQNPEETVNAVMTRSAAKLSTRLQKMLKIPTLPSGVELMNVHNMKEAQQQDSSLARWMTYAKEELSDNQKHEVREILEKYGDILSDVPGKTDLVQHKINLVQE